MEPFPPLLGASTEQTIPSVIRIALDRWVAVVVLERLPSIKNENGGLMPGRASHPDRRGHRSRARIDTLPDAARRPEMRVPSPMSSGVATHPCSWAIHVNLF